MIEDDISVNEVAALNRIIFAYEKTGLTQRHGSEARQRAESEKRETLRVANVVMRKLTQAATQEHEHSP